MGEEVEILESADEAVVPGYRNYLVYCDENGINGSVHYAFGSLWMPSERRGDFVALLDGVRDAHGYRDEIKWAKVTRWSQPFYVALIEEFFRRNWLMFHCLVVRKGYVDKDLHRDYDEARRKHFAMLVKSKIAFFSAGCRDKAYHVRVDPLPSRYPKADEAAFRIVGATLKKELGLAPLKTLFTRNSKSTPGIQLADLLLGATMADWHEDAHGNPKRAVKRVLAEHLGWSDMRADTEPREWKFNIWYFYNPKAGKKREVAMRAVRLKVPMRSLARRR